MPCQVSPMVYEWKECTVNVSPCILPTVLMDFHLFTFKLIKLFPYCSLEQKAKWFRLLEWFYLTHEIDVSVILATISHYFLCILLCVFWLLCYITCCIIKIASQIKENQCYWLFLFFISSTHESKAQHWELNIVTSQKVAMF